MKISELLLLQLIAHILADFFFQTDRLAVQKNQKGFGSTFLKWHFLIVFGLSWLLSFQLLFVWPALIIAISHFLIDGFKKYLNENDWLGKYAFFIDQFLHLLVITAVVLGFTHFNTPQPWWEIPFGTGLLLVIAGYLLCLKPANIFIKEMFRVYEIHVPTENDLPNAGKLIGVLERVLVLTFILLQEFQAVGFLIAAKSILRYKNEDTLKTEYVLIGTMLSFGIAVILGIIISALT